MTTLINKEKQGTVSLLQVKSIVNQMMKNMKFTFTQSLNSYFKQFGGQQIFQQNSQIEQQWTFKIQPKQIQMRAYYSNQRTAQNPLFLWIRQSRLQIDALRLTRTINQKLRYQRFKISKQGFIFIQMSIPYENKNLFSLLKSSVESMEKELKKYFEIFVPLLKLSLRVFNKALSTAFGSIFQQKERRQNKQFLSPQKQFNQLKLHFEQLRQQRKNSTKLSLQKIHQTVQEKQAILAALNLFSGKLQSYMGGFLEAHSFKQNINQQMLNQLKLNNQSFKFLNHKFIYTQISILKSIQQFRVPKQAAGSHSTINMSKYEFKHLPSVNPLVNQCLEEKTLSSSEGISFQDNSQPNQQLTQTSILVCKFAKQLESSKNSFENQLNILMYLRSQKCPFIGKYYRDEIKNGLFSVAYKENLYELLQKDCSQSRVMTVDRKLRLFYQIIKGVCFLAGYQLCHRDLKPANIMINQNYVAKIIDFGSSTTFYGHEHVFIKDKRRKLFAYLVLPTPTYFFDYDKCDPQVKNNFTPSEYDQHSNFDSYSLGRMAQTMFFKMTSGDHNLHLSQDINEILKYIIERCLDQNPDDRLTPKELSIIIAFALGLKI